ncbi:MAG: very short patch repair endonuclease, partial [Gemmatimonadetes bacterium]|nr:very short patch repair endonuclease [Gemmatimonadota bacterium]
MSAIRSTGGKTEVALRSLLHRRGLRFRKNYAKLIGKPDIVFPGARVAVFIDGDYWHARVLREKGPEALYARIKTANRDYWIDKFTRRVKRDDEVTAVLQEDGWTVLRFWESDVRGDLEGVADAIEE